MVFLVQIHLVMNKYTFNNLKNLIFFLKHESENNLLIEICGLVGLDKDKNFVYKHMKNKSKNPEIYFCIDAYDYLCFMKDYDLLFIFHSHVFGDESASEFDCKTSENCCYPFVIYSINSEKFSLYEPNYKSYDVNIIKELIGHI